MIDEIEAKQSEAPEPAKIEVKVIKVDGKTSLVQYMDDGNCRRVYIPSAKVSDDKVDERSLAKGVPYGLPWEKVTLPKITGEDFAEEQHRHGIWTAEDCRSDIKGKRAAIIQLYSPLFLALTEFLHEEKLKSKGGK